MPEIDHAIFADTGWEPRAVYEWLHGYLIPRLPFPVHIVKKGDLRKEQLTARTAGEGKNGVRGRMRGVKTIRKRRAAASTGRLNGAEPSPNACKLPIRSKLEETFALQVRAYGLAKPEREFRFDKARRWRADFAWPACKLLVEVEGGVWSGGRHTRAAGFVADCDKYNRAAELGYAILRFTAEHIKAGTAIQLVEKFVPKEEERRNLL